MLTVVRVNKLICQEHLEELMEVYPDFFGMMDLRPPLVVQVAKADLDRNLLNQCHTICPKGVEIVN